METIHFRAKIRKVGKSLMIEVPKEVVEKEQLLPGQLVRVEMVKFESGFGIMKGGLSFSREDKFQGQLEKRGLI